MKNELKICQENQITNADQNRFKQCLQEAGFPHSDILEKQVRFLEKIISLRSVITISGECRQNLSQFCFILKDYQFPNNQSLIIMPGFSPNHCQKICISSSHKHEHIVDTNDLDGIRKILNSYEIASKVLVLQDIDLYPRPLQEMLTQWLESLLRQGQFPKKTITTVLINQQNKVYTNFLKKSWALRIKLPTLFRSKALQLPPQSISENSIPGQEDLASQVKNHGLRKVLAQIEVGLIVQTLKNNQLQVRKTLRDLRISSSHFYRVMNMKREDNFESEDLSNLGTNMLVP